MEGGVGARGLVKGSGGAALFVGVVALCVMVACSTCKPPLDFFFDDVFVTSLNIKLHFVIV